MANNRMFLVGPDGQRVHLASHFAGKWKIWIEENLVPSLTKAFTSDDGGSTSWHIEYEHHSQHDDPLMPSTADTHQLPDGTWKS